MTEADAGARPYDGLFDPDELAALEKVSPGTADFVLGMIKVDMNWQASRQDRLDRFDFVTRLIAIAFTSAVVLTITLVAAAVINRGHDVAGSILAGADLVALANVLVNAWKRN
jgi:hypothetical protein